VRSESSAADRRTAELAALAVMALWAGNFIVVKGVVTILPPVGFTFLRYIVASVTVLVLLRWRDGSLSLPRSDALRIAILGVVGFGCYQVFWSVGIQTISAGDSALLIATTPVWTTVLAALSGADTLSPTRLAGALLSFAGVAVVIGSGPGFDLGASLIGDVLTLIAALCWAIYTAYGANVLRRHSPLKTTTWAIVAGTLFLAPLGLAQLASSGLAGSAEAALGTGTVLAVVLAILYSGTLAAGTANVVIFHAIKLVGPTRITALQSLVPAMAVILAAIFLGEPIRPGQVLGGAVIIAGVAILRRGTLPGMGRLRSERTA
jgi:drug/metabolite transporter (DMT)-like permease